MGMEEGGVRMDEGGVKRGRVKSEDGEGGKR